MLTLVESDNGTIYVLGGGCKRPLVPAPAGWGDTEFGLKQLVDGGLARWATPRKQTQGALNLIPDGDAATIVTATGPSPAELDTALARVIARTRLNPGA